METVGSVVLKSLMVWMVIAIAETLHGILRVKFLNSRLGDRRARRVGVLTGTIIIFIVGWALIPWINPQTLQDSLVVGLVWLVAMFAFDIGFGRLYLRYSWGRIWSDFNFLQGGYLGLGMAALLLVPWVVARVRGLI